MSNALTEPSNNNVVFEMALIFFQTLRIPTATSIFFSGMIVPTFAGKKL